MSGRTAEFTVQAIGECSAFVRIIFGGRAYHAARAALAVGIGYLFAPFDLIPARTPYVGHLDELGILIVSFVIARKIAPAPPARWPRRSENAGPLPNFLIVGAPRCGTTSLYDALGRHPDVFCCPVKEPNHFCTDRSARPWVLESAKRRAVLIASDEPRSPALPRVATTTDIGLYKSLFSDWGGERAIGEASTAYLLSSEAAAEIAKVQPGARIIVVLRQPVQRSQSEYLMHLQLGRAKTDLDAVLAGHTEHLTGELQVLKTIIEGSLYAPQIRRLLEHFPRENVLFLLFEDLVRTPASALRAAFLHIGVSPDQGESIVLARENESRAVKSHRLNRLVAGTGLREVITHLLPAKLRRRLACRYYKAAPTARPAIDIGLFREDIAETERLIGRSLAHWLPCKDRRSQGATQPGIKSELYA
jgi:hypothetical protein